MPLIAPPADTPDSFRQFTDRLHREIIRGLAVTPELLGGEQPVGRPPAASAFPTWRLFRDLPRTL